MSQFDNGTAKHRHDARWHLDGPLFFALLHSGILLALIIGL
ncbi:MAG: hypothetical protein U5L01_09370 [Rheinheimera sp.]|nr:hypothetical protein [Rheinheimera sp.]